MCNCMIARGKTDQALWAVLISGLYTPQFNTKYKDSTLS